MIIKPNSNRTISYMSEEQMYDKYLNNGISGPFELSDKVLLGVQIIGDHLKVQNINCNSSLRTKEYNAKIGGSRRSQHITGNAIDISFPNNDRSNKEIIAEFWEDMLCKGDLYQKLVQVGIKGIGSYSSFIHIDDGESSLNKRGSVQGWYSGGPGKGWSTRYISRTPDYSCGPSNRNISKDIRQAIRKGSFEKMSPFKEFILGLNDPEDGYIPFPRGIAFGLAFYASIAVILVGIVLIYIQYLRNDK